MAPDLEFVKKNGSWNAKLSDTDTGLAQVVRFMSKTEYVALLKVSELTILLLGRMITTRLFI